MHQRHGFHYGNDGYLNDWASTCMAICLGLLFLYVIGPLPFVAYGLQLWAASSRWDWMDRWASIRAIAICGGLLFALIGGLLVVPFSFFRLLLHALWVHLPLLGEFSLIPLSLANVPARWLLLLPLAPALALLFERVLPRTTGYLMRVLLPHEVEQLRRQQQDAAAIVRTELPPDAPVEASKPKRRRSAPPRRKPARSKRELVVRKSSPQEALRPSRTPEVSEQSASGEQASSPIVPTAPAIDWSQVEE